MVMPTVIVLLGDINKTDNPCEVFKIMPGTKSTHTHYVKFFLLAGSLLVRFSPVFS